MAADLLAQLRLRGSLAARFGFVLRLQWLYVRARRRGLDRPSSQNEARRALARAGLSGRIVRLKHPYAGWMKIDLQSASYLAKELLVDGAYEERESFVPRAGQTVVDVGAHQGLFALRAAARVGASGRVVAVEAYPPNARLLRENVAACAPDRVTVVEGAVMAQSGDVKLYVTDDVSGGQSTKFADGRSAITVKAETLDALLERVGAPKPDLVKIDVEGAYLDVLQGAPRTLAARPRLVIEVEGDDAERDRVVRWLRERGYAVESVMPLLYAQREAA